MGFVLKKIVIAAAIALALLAAAGVYIINKKDSNPATGSAPPNVRIMEDNSQTDNPADEALQRQLDELKAQVEELESEKGAAQFDRNALQAEQENLQRRIAELEEQNRYLRDRNNALSDKEQHLRGEVAARDDKLASKDEELAALDRQIADLNERLAQLEKEREESEAAYVEALAQANSVPGTRFTEDGDLVSTFNTIKDGQARNIFGIKIGGSDIDIEGTFALMPHWFLVVDAGAVEVSDDFVEDEFPGLIADHAFVYTAMFGTGLNWRFNSIQGQPNIYLATMAGPAWYPYKDDGKVDVETYLLWRSSIGFDLTLYKNLQFTTDVSFDWMKDYGFTPHLTVGLQWSFSNSWALFGGNK